MRRLALNVAAAAALLALAPAPLGRTRRSRAPRPSAEPSSRSPRGDQARLQRARRAQLRLAARLRLRRQRGPVGRPGAPGRRDEEIAVALPDDLPDGSYTATYRVVSADSHPVSGGFVFAVGEGSAAPAASVSELVDDEQASAATKAPVRRRLAPPRTPRSPWPWEARSSCSPSGVRPSRPRAAGDGPTRPRRASGRACAKLLGWGLVGGDRRDRRRDRAPRRGRVWDRAARRARPGRDRRRPRHPLRRRLGGPDRDLRGAGCRPGHRAALRARPRARRPWARGQACSCSRSRPPRRSRATRRPRAPSGCSSPRPSSTSSP